MYICEPFPVSSLFIKFLRFSHKQTLKRYVSFLIYYTHTVCNFSCGLLMVNLGTYYINKYPFHSPPYISTCPPVKLFTCFLSILYPYLCVNNFKWLYQHNSPTYRCAFYQNSFLQLVRKNPQHCHEGDLYTTHNTGN